MNKDTIVYLPVSVEYNPNKSGWYLCTKSKDLEGAWYGHGYFKDGEWESSEIKHWLKPLTVEALLKEMKGNDENVDRARNIWNVGLMLASGIRLVRNCQFLIQK